MIELTRETTADRINAIVNDPSILPYVKGAHTGPLDLAPVVERGEHVVLTGEHGGIVFIKHLPGIYEAHTSVLPEGRGEWTVAFGQAAAHWMFTRTDAYELMTKCPHGNLAAVAGARRSGASLAFSTRPIWQTDAGMVPVDVYSLILQHWVRTAPGLVELGREFHLRLAAEIARAGLLEDIHPDDEVHDRYVGGTAAMIVGGQPFKAIGFYNRWAVMSAYEPIRIASRDPLIINIKTCFLKVIPGGFEVLNANGRN